MDDRFKQIEDQYFRLKGQLAAGRITQDQFDAALRQLMIQDGQGRYWILGVDDARWYVNNGQSWVSAELPGGATSAPPTVPAYAVPPSVAHRFSPLMVAVAAATVLLVIALTAWLVLSQGKLNLARAVVTATPAAAAAAPTTVPPTVPPPTATAVAIAATAVPTLAATELPTSPTVSAADLITQADALTFQSKFDDAAALYRQAISLDATNALAHARLARLLAFQAYLEVRDDLSKQAVSEAEAAAQIAPQDAEVNVWLSRAYDWSGDAAKALAAAQSAVKLAANSAEAHAVLSEAYLDNNKLADGQREAQQAVLLDPNNADGHRILGFVLSLTKQLESAVAEFEKAAELEPNLALRHYELASLYRRASEFDKATAETQSAIALYPRSVRALVEQGNIYRDQRQFTQAIESYNAALQLNDRVVAAYLGLAQSNLGAGNQSAARAAAQKALALDLDNQPAKSILANIAAASASPISQPAPTVAATAPSAPPTPSAPPGIYVTSMRVDPTQPKNLQLLTFYPTFDNTTGGAQNYRWCVELFTPDNFKTSFGITPCTNTTIPAGSTELGTDPNYRIVRGGECLPLVARAVYIDSSNARIPFLKPDGSVFWFGFQVCP